jgi:hypothetical protein
MRLRATSVDPSDGTRAELASLGAEWSRLSSDWHRRAVAWAWLATQWSSSRDTRLRGASRRAGALSQQAHGMVAHLRAGALELLNLAVR